MFISPLCYISVMGQPQLYSVFSSLRSPGRKRSTAGLKTSLHILLAKANPIPSLTSIVFL